MLVRLTTQQVIEAFGDPEPYMLADGTIGAAWEKSIIAYAKLPAPLPYFIAPGRSVGVTRFKCHRRTVAAFEGFMQAIYAEPPVWKDWSDGGFGGVYEFRKNRRNAGELSRHAWAIAIDGDVADNPQGREPKVHARLPKIAEAHGFAWGGLFKGRARDGMHFEFADLSRLS